MATFAACNFAAFLTRSGIFSSLHTFSQSPIGWMFLLLIVGLAVAAAALLFRRRRDAVPERAISGLWAKESVATASVFVLIVLSAAVFCGTVSMPVSQTFFSHKILLGAGFYNGVLIPTGLLLLAAMAVAPLTQWGSPPNSRQAAAMAISAAAGAAMAGVCWLAGLRHPLTMTIAGLGFMAAIAIIASWMLAGTVPIFAGTDRAPSTDGRRWSTKKGLSPSSLLQSLRHRRRTYAGFTMHLGVACLAVGVAGSSLGTQERDVTLSNGETIHCGGYDIRFARLHEQQLPEKLVVRAELEVTTERAAVCTLLPAQEYHFLQNQWSGQVAIHSQWSGDLYTILHSGQGHDRIWLTVISASDDAMDVAVGLDRFARRPCPGFGRRERSVERLLVNPWRSQQIGAEKPLEEFPAMREPETAIRASQLSKSFGGRPVLAALDLEIAAGQCVALTGRNGAGKTTLLGCLASALRPDAGEVRWFGQTAGRDAALRRWVGMVAHESGLYPHLSLRENLLFAARMSGADHAARRARNWLDKAGLLPHADVLPTRISRGMRQRLAVARAIIHDPRLLLLDEPFTSLDESGAEWLLALLAELRDRGCTICFVTHDQEKIRRLAHRVVELREGKVYDAAVSQYDCRPIIRAA